MEEKIKLANDLITLLERIEGLGNRNTIPQELVTNAKRVILEQLVIIFPSPPPPE